VGTKVAVIGAGAWGTALAQLMAGKGDPTRLWAFEAEVAAEINATGENRTYLPGIKLDGRLRASASLAEVLAGAELVLLVTPSHVLRAVISQAATQLPKDVPIVCAAKGIENETLMNMCEVLEDTLPTAYHPMLAFLSGPSFAQEVARQHPTAVSVAARFEKLAERVQLALASPFFRVYTSSDVVGVALGGALKNVIAIAAGASSGLGFGANTQAALITRGLAEITRLAVKQGANPLTLAGLSGMGDLVLTCTGPLSRNRQVGEKLGRGMRREEIIKDMRQVAEGIKTARSARDLAAREGAEMPIAEQVYRMLYENLPAREALSALLGRSLKREWYS
jgi:glycerol-3-phosphate dehydrogenase (NAD(P)+)